MKYLRWNLGIAILRFGYWLRGDIPQKTWSIYDVPDKVYKPAITENLDHNA